MGVKRYLLLGIVAITLVVFWRTHNFDFVWDDGTNVAHNPYLKQVTLENTLVFWQRPYAKLYIPLSYSAWAGIAAIGKMTAPGLPGTKNPRPFHLMNLLLHVLSVVVVFVILMRLVRDPWGCAAGALLFGLHPVQVEPVAWVTGMKDVLCGLLSLLALWQYLIYAESARSTIERPGGAKRKRAAVRPTQVKWVHYGLGTVALVLAMLAKPAAVAVPLIVAVFEQRVIKRPWRQWVLTVGAWVAITVPFIILTQWAQPATELTAIPPLWVRPFIAADALAFYLYKLIAPVSLSVDYGRSPDVVQRGWVYFTWIIPFGIAAWIWFTKKEKGWLIAAAAVFTAGLLPVLGFIPFGFQNISTVTDRYLYLAMLGPALLLASFCSRLKTQLSWIAVALILALFGLRSAVQLQVWQNNDSLFQHALSLNPNSWMAELNLGVGLAQRGRADEAIAHYQTALKIRPGYPHALNNLGNTFLAKGRLEEALEYYRQALQSEPDAPDIHFNMASVLMKVNRPEEAVEHLRISLRAEPDSASTHELLGDALLKQNKGEEAAAHYRKALKIEPGSAEAHYKLADILESRGDLDGALGEYLEAVRCQPDYAAAYLNVGIILANRGQLDAATNYFYKALQVRPQFAEAHEMLARALAFQGKMDEAARHYQQAAGNAQ